MKINTIIVEDDKDSQLLLSQILREFCPSIILLGIASDIPAAKLLLDAKDIDLVFLDIQLKERNSFSLLDLFPDREFKVVFTTAFDDYAIKAFKYDAIDYILKPYSPKEIIASIGKITESLLEKKLLGRIAMSQTQKLNTKLKLSTSDGITLVEQNDIIRLEAEGSYSSIYMAAGNKHTISKSLKEVQKSLGNSFYRVHDSHIINLSHVKKYDNSDGGFVALSLGNRVPVSRRRKQDFIDTLKAL